MTAEPRKDTIYIDIDDEITSIIDKVRSADQKIIALVLPKRATVLQSVVNMKLLKKSADDAKKHLVLITSEAGLLPLAGAAGLHVASTLQSKPAIPRPPELPGDETENIDEPLDIVDGSGAVEDGYDPATAASRPIGELASNRAGQAALDGTIELDNSDNALEGATDAAKAPKPKKDRKLRVPNFGSFRKRMLLAASIIILLIIAWIIANAVLPHATITIHTDTSTIKTNLTATVDTAAKQFDPGNAVIPATSASEQKSYSQQVPTTGQQNNGQTATGTITMSVPCSAVQNGPVVVPQGTGVSQGGLTYITQSDTTLSTSDFKGGCHFTGSSTIDAIKAGAAYNVSSTSFSVSNFPNVSATGSASGGTDDIVKVVSQADINKAESQISAKDTSSIKQDLKNQLQGQQLMPLVVTFTAGKPQTTTSANVGDKTDTVTVTEVINYTMLGVKQSDLAQLVDANVKTQLDKGKQVILDDGVKTASFGVQDQSADGNKFTLNISAKSIAGPQLDVASIKKQVAGKKAGDVKKLLENIPGVTGVDVKYSPFWVDSVPSSPGKVTVQLDKSNTGHSS